MRLVAVGDVLVDVVSEEAPGRDERLHAPVAIRAGGSAANAAVWAVELGASATVVGRIGADASGDLVERVLTEKGIEARIARDPDLPTGVAVALGSSVVAWAAASSRLAPEDVPDPLPGDALLVSGFSLFQAASAFGARAGLERFDGRWMAVDLASPRLAAAADLDELCGGANVILATIEEARAVTGSEPDDAVRELAVRFGVACVKLGEEGALAAQGDQVVHAQSDRVERRSRFGAGDAFAAALLVTLSEGQPLEQALDAACSAGARAAASNDGWPP
ncbi:MAG TPA: carbohydrate kinase family protein [Gaiellaceae bacterium]|nr:carbohydrate kinase family protein [Gaiellaceae bacterium]